MDLQKFHSYSPHTVARCILQDLPHDGTLHALNTPQLDDPRIGPAFLLECPLGLVQGQHHLAQEEKVEGGESRMRRAELGEGNAVGCTP